MLFEKSKFEEKEIQIFSPEEIVILKKEIYKKYSNGKQAYKLPEIFVFILNTGLRMGEVLALKWIDVNFESNSIEVRRTVVYVKNREKDGVTQTNGKTLEIQEITKTQSGKRRIYLNNTALKCIGDIKIINGNREFVFSNTNSEVLSPHSLTKTFSSIQEKANISPKRGLHALRHPPVKLKLKIILKSTSSLESHSN